MARPIKGASSNAGSQTLRERFRRVMHFEKPDRLPFFEFGYWAETLPTWHSQGLPEAIVEQWQAYEYFGIENWAGTGVNQWLLPEGQREVLEETADFVIYRETDRVVKQEQKTSEKSIPHFLDFPIKKREDWAWFKERLNPDTPGRLPSDFAEEVKRLNAGDEPVTLEYASLCGRLRNWMGFENYAMATLTDQDFLCEMMDDLVSLSAKMIERAFAAGLKADIGSGWEDITFNSGPIVHPDFFYKEVVPRYKRLTDILRANGCDVIWVDSDGNINRLVDGWLAGGINCMFPLEVNGGSDPVALREKYGQRLLLVGGVDKMRLQGDTATIKKELKRIQPVVEDGGYIPLVDHRVPPTVPLKNYMYYLDAKRDMFNAGKLSPQYGRKAPQRRLPGPKG